MGHSDTRVSEYWRAISAMTAAADALTRARAGAARATPHDRAHIEARGLQSAAEHMPADASLLAAYRAALDRDLQAFPSDEEFWIARGHAESADPAEHGQGSTAAAVRFYQKAAALAPAHFAAHHFLTHAFENSGRIDEALTEGAAYARMAPQIPHARHMHGHDLRRLGKIEEAIAEFVAADDIARASMALLTGMVLERCADGDAYPEYLNETINRAVVLGLPAAAAPRLERAAR